MGSETIETWWETVKLKSKEAACRASVSKAEGARSKQEDNEEDQESGVPSYLSVIGID